MNINLIKRKDGSFIPAFPSDFDKAKNFKVGEEFNFVHKKIRNPKFHRKYFAMIRMIFDCQDLFTDQTVMRKYLEMKAGYYTVTKTDVGDLILPKSISFENLDEDEFSVLYDKVCSIVYEKFAMDNKEVEKFLVDFM